MLVITLSANSRAANSVECSVRNPYWLSYKCRFVLKKLSNTGHVRLTAQLELVTWNCGCICETRQVQVRPVGVRT